MAAMTFLQGVQRLALECGVPTAPSAVTSQSGEMLRLVDWYQQAYIEIQELHHDWQWLTNDFTFNTTSTQQAYTPAQAGITDFGAWKLQSMRAYTQGNAYKDEQLLIPVPYEVFRNQYMYGNMRTTYARPMSFAIDPATKSLLLGPIPDATGWTVLGQYFRKPTTLAANGDTPVLPDKFHMAIVYKAMISYGMFEAAPEVVQRGQQGYGAMLAQMEIDQIPGFGFGAPLA